MSGARTALDLLEAEAFDDMQAGTIIERTAVIRGSLLTPDEAAVLGRFVEQSVPEPLQGPSLIELLGKLKQIAGDS